MLVTVKSITKYFDFLKLLTYILIEIKSLKYWPFVGIIERVENLNWIIY